MPDGEAEVARAAPAGADGGHELLRELKLRHAAAVVVGTIIGSGIFLVPREMMQAVGSAKLVYLAWIVGGALSFAGALTYAELGALKPQAGGEYVYMRDGYGPLGGFLYAWTTILIAKPGSIATVVTGMVRMLESFGGLGVLPHVLVMTPITITYGHLVAIAISVLVSAVNYIGVRRAGEFQVVFTTLKVAVIVGVIAIAFSYRGGTLTNFGTTYAGARGGIAGFVIALVAALWAYDGWSDLSTVAGEIKRPGSTIPIALIAGVGLVAALYILINAAVQYVLPAAAIAASARPATDVVLVVVGTAGAAGFALAIVAQMLATVNGITLSGSRITFALARDGHFPAALARVHPRFRTPANAIIFQQAVVILLVLFGGTFQQLFSITIFAEWLFYMLTAGTVFIFRRREPDAERPYRVWGYPVLPALFIAAAAFLLYQEFMANLRNSALGVLLILAGIPVFLFFDRRRRSQ